MAKYEDGSYSSTPGIALIGKVLAGRCKMHYTRAAVGKGEIPEGQSPKTMTEPADYVMDAKIAAVTNPVNGECQVTVQINSSDVEHGFYCTGILLYAEDPDDGEVPYTYLVLENGPEWIRPSSSAVGKLATFDLIAAVGDVDKVTATVSPDALVTHKELSELLNGIGTDISIVNIPSSGWVPDTDTGGAYALHLDIANVRITEKMVPAFNIHPLSLEAAMQCVLCPAVRTMDGVLRLYAQTVPQSAMTATLTLLDSSYIENGAISGSAVKLLDDFTIPKTGWVADSDTGGAYALHLDIDKVEITADMVPSLTVLPGYMAVAAECQFSPLSRTMDKMLRVYAKTAPTQPIKGSLALVSMATYSNGGGMSAAGGAISMPIATADTPGAVKPGNGLTVTVDGTLSVDKSTVMTDEDLVDESEVAESVANILDGD